MMLAVLAVALSCGLDTLAVAISIGIAQLRAPGLAASPAADAAGRLRVGLVFAAFEGLMPILGLLLGRSLEGAIGTIAYAIGLVLLAGVGVSMLVFDHDEGVRANLQGARILLAGLWVSIDELAVGFSAGLARFPIAITAALLGLQAFVFVWVGIAFGARMRPLFGEAAEKAAGVALILLAAYLALRRWVF